MLERIAKFSESIGTVVDTSTESHKVLWVLVTLGIITANLAYLMLAFG